jgi:hypothetical protein
MPLKAYSKLTKSKKMFDIVMKRIKLTKRKQGGTMKDLKITTAVRMLCEMREKLEVRAAENGRSLSGEIIFRLRKSLEQEQDHEKQQE